jgi:hypothetical protein
MTKKLISYGLWVDGETPDTWIAIEEREGLTVRKLVILLNMIGGSILKRSNIAFRDAVHQLHLTAVYTQENGAVQAFDKNIANVSFRSVPDRSIRIIGWSEGDSAEVSTEALAECLYRKVRQYE